VNLANSRLRQIVNSLNLVPVSRENRRLLTVFNDPQPRSSWKNLILSRSRSSWKNLISTRSRYSISTNCNDSPRPRSFWKDLILASSFWRDFI
jgi:hypothetical protein